jgi:hypothetical protein
VGRPGSSRATPIATKRSNRRLRSVAVALAVAACASSVSKISTLRARHGHAVGARRPRVGARAARARRRGRRPRPPRGHMRASRSSAMRDHHPVAPPLRALGPRLRRVGEAMHQTDDRWFAPELHRVKGELLLQARRWDEGKESLQHALSTAREQSARLLELRAATSLANFWKGRGQKDQASELLGPLCSWFTEGLETSDLQEARALLKEIDAFVG